MAQGVFSFDAKIKTIKLSQTYETNFIKLVALSAFDTNKPFASLAELDIITP